MKNLKAKKILAIALAVATVFSSNLAVVSADEIVEDALEVYTDEEAVEEVITDAVEDINEDEVNAGEVPEASMKYVQISCQGTNWKEIKVINAEETTEYEVTKSHGCGWASNNLSFYADVPTGAKIKIKLSDSKYYDNESIGLNFGENLNLSCQKEEDGDWLVTEEIEVNDNLDFMCFRTPNLEKAEEEDKAFTYVNVYGVGIDDASIVVNTDDGIIDLGEEIPLTMKAGSGYKLVGLKYRYIDGKVQNSVYSTDGESLIAPESVGKDRTIYIDVTSIKNDQAYVVNNCDRVSGEYKVGSLSIGETLYSKDEKVAYSVDETVTIHPIVSRGYKIKTITIKSGANPGGSVYTAEDLNEDGNAEYTVKAADVTGRSEIIVDAEFEVDDEEGSYAVAFGDYGYSIINESVRVVFKTGEEIRIIDDEYYDEDEELYYLSLEKGAEIKLVADYNKYYTTDFKINGESLSLTPNEEDGTIETDTITIDSPKLISLDSDMDYAAIAADKLFDYSFIDYYNKDFSDYMTDGGIGWDEKDAEYFSKYDEIWCDADFIGNKYGFIKENDNISVNINDIYGWIDDGGSLVDCNIDKIECYYWNTDDEVVVIPVVDGKFRAPSYDDVANYDDIKYLYFRVKVSRKTDPKQEQLEKEVKKQTEERKAVTEAKGGTKNDPVVVEVKQALNDTVVVKESYVKGKAKTRTIAVSANAVNKVTLNAGAKFMLEGTDFKVENDAENAAKVSKKGVLTAKAVKGKKTYGFSVKFKDKDGNPVTVDVTVNNIAVDKAIKNTVLYSAAGEVKDSTDKVIKTVPENLSTESYVVKLDNCEMSSGVWTLNAGKGDKICAKMEVSADGNTAKITPVAGKKGTAKITCDINGKKYTTSIKILDSTAKKLSAKQTTPVPGK